MAHVRARLIELYHAFCFRSSSEHAKIHHANAAQPRSPRPLTRKTARLRMSVDANSDEPSRSADGQGPLATWRSLERRRL